MLSAASSIGQSKPILREERVVRPRGNRPGTEWSEERRAAHLRSTRTESFRESHRQALLRRLPTMRGPAVNSPIERRLHDALRARGIGFSTHSLLLARYLVDIEIVQVPVIIEADGAQHQLSAQRRRDEIRDAALTAAGYRVHRFTGSEINRDAGACIEQVVNAHGLTADEDPRYLIRTRFAGPTHPRWAGPDVSHVCLRCGATFSTRPNRRGRYCGLPCYFARSRS